jgi:hypothetical protein
MMRHPCQLRFLFTRETDTSHYTALKIGRSETGREKRVTPEFGEYRKRKILPPKFWVLQNDNTIKDLISLLSVKQKISILYTLDMNGCITSGCLIRMQI